jgi:3-dehydroquinate dehydratase type I
MPKIEAEALRQIKQAEDCGAELVEVRFDAIEGARDLKGIARCGKLQKIAADKNPGSTEREKHQLLLNAARSGFAYVDIDLSNSLVQSFAKEVKAAGAKCIVSFHNYKSSPSTEELGAVLDKQLAAGADVCKIVTTPKQQNENLALLQFTQSVSLKAKVVCFGMGELGKISRLLSPVFGGYFTFASLERGSETAPGQMSINEMRTAYQLLGL